jgi:hypothetical protein
MGVVKSTYVSEHGKWMQEQIDKHPEWEEERRAGRALWWDKRQDLQVNARYEGASVPRRPYPYDVNS